jgi:anti-sigma factor RsiW
MMWKISSRSGACRAQEVRLEEYLEGHLRSERRQQLEAHLAQCSRCADALERGRAGTSLLRAGCVPAAGPGETFTRRVMTAVTREESRREAERARWHPLQVIVARMALSAALALGALLTAATWLRQPVRVPVAQPRVVDLMPEPAHVTAASQDVLMAAIAEDHGK